MNCWPFDLLFLLLVFALPIGLTVLAVRPYWKDVHGSLHTPPYRGAFDSASHTISSDFRDAMPRIDEVKKIGRRLQGGMNMMMLWLGLSLFLNACLASALFAEMAKDSWWGRHYAACYLNPE